MLRKSVASKFNLLIVLSVVISVAISSVSITIFLLHRYTEDVIEKDRLHMKGLASSVKGFIDHAFSLNYLLSINPEIVEHVAAAPKDWSERVAEYNRQYETSLEFKDNSGLPLLVNTQKRYDFVELFFVQDASGAQTSRSFGPLGNRGQRWWFRKITENQNYRSFMSKSYYSMTGDKPVASAFHPIYRDNRFIGVMGTDINFDELQGMVRNYLDTKDLYAVVIDPEGVIIAHPDRNKLRELYNLNQLTKNVLIRDEAGGSIQDKSGHHQTKEVKLEWDQRVSRIVSDALSGSSGMAENVRLEGKDSTIYYEPIRLPGTDSHDHYSLLLIRDNSSLTKAKLTIIAFVLLFIALALVIFIFFFRIQFRKIVLKPLGKLANSMKDAQIANHEDVELGTHDEFQLLGDTYNQMRQSLVHASEKLTEINERLEQLVDERTAELRRVNQELLQDIAKREQIEKALQQSEERYRSLVENTLDGYFICQIPSGKFLFLNRRICSLAGYTMEQGKNLTVWQVIDPAAHDQIAGLIQDRLNGKFMKFDRRIYTLIRKDGSVFRAEVSTSLVTFQGQTAVQGVLRDITEQERLQEQLQKAERMQSIGTLAGGIAHDFNNLLMGVQGRTSLMLLDVDNSHPFHGQLKGIEDHVKRAADLTNQLLGFAMGGKYQVAPVDLNRLIQENISMFARTKKELSINLKFQEKIWSAAIDRSQIDQVLLNLYVNAWQAMPGGGRLYIQTQNCRLDDKFVKPFHVEPGKYIEISITDTGVGMDGETRKRIFDPFFTTKERGRGTGLGLASAYGIIKNHEGIITVRSEKGKGTTFTIYLPVSDIPVREVRIAPEEQLFGAGTILLIDDEEMILDVGKALLQKLGYQVLVAASGRKGLEIYRQNPAKIDLIILDMIMPEMNGGETYERLREIDPRVKVLLSSGYTMDGVANDILKQGPHCFIQKPFDIKKLSRKVRKALQNPEPEN
jgi:PAS domain S-box-containing protein